MLSQYIMKKETHPTYYPNATVVCACGNTFTVGSTMEEMRIDICSVCHPFYTGKQKLIDTAGRVERFKERNAKQTAAAAVHKGKKAKKAKALVRKTKAKKIEEETAAER